MTQENANSKSKNKIIKRTCQCLLTTALVIPALTSVSYATQVDNDMQNHIKQHVEQEVNTRQNNGVSNSPLNKTEGKTQDRTVTTNKEQEKPKVTDREATPSEQNSDVLTDQEIEQIKKQAKNMPDNKGYEFTDTMVNALKSELEQIKNAADFATQKQAKIKEAIEKNFPKDDKDSPVVKRGWVVYDKKNGNTQLDGADVGKIYMGEPNGKKGDKSYQFTYQAMDPNGTETIKSFTIENAPKGTKVDGKEPENAFDKEKDPYIKANDYKSKGKSVDKLVQFSATDEAKAGKFEMLVKVTDGNGNTSTIRQPGEVKVYIPAENGKILEVEVFSKDFKPDEAIGIYHEMYENENQENAIREKIKNGETAGKIVDKNGYLPKDAIITWKTTPIVDKVTEDGKFLKGTALVKYQKDGKEYVEEVENIKIKVVDTKAPDIRRSTLNTVVDKNNPNYLDGKDFGGHNAFVGDDTIKNGGFDNTGLKFGYRTFDNSGRIKEFKFEGQPNGSTVAYQKAKDGEVSTDNSKGMDYNSGDPEIKLAFDDPKADEYNTKGSPLFGYLFIQADNTNKVGKYNIKITSTDAAGHKTEVTNYINVKTYLPVAAKELSLEKGENATNIAAKDYIGAYLEKYDTKNARTKAQVKADIDGNKIDKTKISADKDKYFPTQGTTYEWVTAPNTNQEPGDYTAVAKVIFTDKNGNKVEELVNIPYTVKPSTKPNEPKVEQQDDKVTVSPANGDTNTKKLEIKYTDKDGQTVTVTATKEGSGWKVTPDVDGVEVDENGNVTIENSKVQPGSDISVVAKNDNKQSEPTSATTSPKSPEVGTNDKGDVTVKPSDKADSLEIKYTPEGEGTTEKTVTAKKDDQGKWKFEGDATGLEINEDTGAVTIKKGTAKEKQPVKATSKTKNSKPSTESTITVPDKTAPTAPQVGLAGDNSGDVTITPANDDTSKVTITYTDKNGKTQNVEATKGNDSKWTVPADSGLKVSKDGKTITVPKAITKDETEVKAKATDGNNNNSGDNKVTVPDKTAPTQPTVTVDDKTGNITVKAPDDKDIKTVEIKYTDKDGQPKTVTATKGDDGNWKIEPNDSAVKFENGEFTVPADRVSPGTKVNVSAIDKSGNKAEKGQESKPSKPTIAENEDQTIEITPQGDVDKVKIKYMPADGSGEKEIVAKKKAGGSGWEIENAPQGITVDNTGTVKFVKGVAKENTPIKASSIKGDSNSSLENELQVPDHTAPDAPTVTAKDGGRIDISDPSQLKGEPTKVTVTYTAPNGEKKTAELTKGENGQWSTSSTDLVYDKVTGNYYLPKDKVKAGSDVSVVAEDNSGNKTDANNKVTTAPEAPKLEQADDGAVTVTPPAEGATSIELSYKDPSGKDKTVTVKKDGNVWKVDGENPDGVTVEDDKVKIPADKVQKGSAVIAKASNEKNVSSEVGSTTTKPEVPNVEEVEKSKDITVTPPVNADSVEITYTPAGATEAKIVVVTKGADGKWKPEGETDLTIDEDKGVVTIAKGKAKEKSDVKVTSKVKKKVPANVEKDKFGAVTVTPPQDAKTVEITYTPANATEAKTVVVTKGEDGTWKLPEGVTDLVINNGVVTIQSNKLAPNTPVTAIAKTADELKSEEKTQKVPDLTPPTKPEVKTDENGNVTVKVPTEDDVQTLTITYKDPATGKDKTVTVKKDGNNWKVDGDNPDGITVKDDVVTIQADKVKKGTSVIVKATDNSNNTSESGEVTTKPEAPTVTPVQKSGDVKVTPPNNAEKMEITYTPVGATEEKKVVVTKGANGKWKLPEGEKDLTIDDNGVVTIAKGKAKEKSDVKVTSKVTKEVSSKVEKDKNGAVTVTPPQNAKTVEITYTPVGATEAKTVVLTKGEDGTWELPEGATDLAINNGVVTIQSDKLTPNTPVTAIAKTTDEVSSEENTQKVPDMTAPSAPTVTVSDDGKLTIQPPKDDDVKTVEVSYVGKDGNNKTAIATKGDDGNWTISGDSDGITVDKNGVITIAEATTQANSEVTVTAKDKAENASQPAKAKAKTLADRTQIKLPFRTSVVSVYELRDSEKEEVKKAIQDKNKDENGKSTLPEGTTIEVDEKGNATIKFKDGSSIVIESEKLVKNKYFGTTTDESSNGNDAPALDKSQLQTEVDKENSVKDSDNYKNADKSKKDAYDKALQEGKKVLDKKDATQSEVDKAKSQLEKAKSELNGKNESGDNKPSDDKKPSDDNKQNKVDKKPLEKETNNSIATKETKKYKNADKDKKYNYEKALKKAKEVLANKKATQEEVNKALANLEKAKAQLNGKEVANSPSKRAKKLPKAGSTAETFTLSIAGLLSAAGAFLGLKKKDEDR